MPNFSSRLKGFWNKHFVPRNVYDALEQECQDIRKHIESANGEVKLLHEWVDDLKKERDELKYIIYRRFGLVVPNVPEQEFRSESIPQIETWRTAKRKFESVHHQAAVTQAEELKKQQEYWDNKLRGQEEKGAEKAIGTE